MGQSRASLMLHCAAGDVPPLSGPLFKLDFWRRRAIAQWTMGAHRVIQLSHWTPTIWLNAGFFTATTIGPGVMFSFIVWSRSQAFRLRDAGWPAMSQA